MEIERNLGAQPIADVMQQYQLKSHDLVAASTGQLTHKMVARAVKGRRLTDNTRKKVIAALQQVTGRTFAVAELFNYE
ncbi:MAG: hypothetical protein R3C59_02675 [Planctomycetaceae bacterium]